MDRSPSSYDPKRNTKKRVQAKNAIPEAFNTHVNDAFLTVLVSVEDTTNRFDSSAADIAIPLTIHQTIISDDSVNIKLKIPQIAKQVIANVEKNITLLRIIV